MPVQSSGAAWKSKWPSWAPVPNKPTVSVDVKQHFDNLCTLEDWVDTPEIHLVLKRSLMYTIDNLETEEVEKRLLLVCRDKAGKRQFSEPFPKSNHEWRSSR